MSTKFVAKDGLGWPLLSVVRSSTTKLLNKCIRENMKSTCNYRKIGSTIVFAEEQNAQKKAIKSMVKGQFLKHINAAKHNNVICYCGEAQKNINMSIK